MKTPKATRSKDWITCSEAARELGISRNTVMYRAARGRYRLKEFGGTPFVWRRDVEKAKAAA